MEHHRVGCKSATAAYVLRQMKPRLQLSSPIQFKLVATRDEQGALSLPIIADPPVPSMLNAVRGTAIINTTPQITEEQLVVLERQVSQRCPVADMMTRAGVDLKVHFTTGP